MPVGTSGRWILRPKCRIHKATATLATGSLQRIAAPLAGHGARALGTGSTGSRPGPGCDSESGAPCQPDSEALSEESGRHPARGRGQDAPQTGRGPGALIGAPLTGWPRAGSGLSGRLHCHWRSPANGCVFNVSGPEY